MTAARPSAVAPQPAEAEAVAIVTAIEALWPRPVVVVATTHPEGHAWRFSGRWWARPVAARRDRPFY